MIVHRVLFAVLIAASLSAATLDALAQSPPSSTSHPAATKRHPKRASPKAISDAAPSGATSKTWSDLVHGSAEQQQLEREDNDIAHPAPINRSKDDFFGDWHGIK